MRSSAGSLCTHCPVTAADPILCLAALVLKSDGLPAPLSFVALSDTHELQRRGLVWTLGLRITDTESYMNLQGHLFQHSHFLDKKTEAQRGQETCSRSCLLMSKPIGVRVETHV